MPEAVPIPGKKSAPASGTLSRLGGTIRAGEWWEYKLVPILSLFYATAVLADTPVASLWQSALTLLLALAPGAAWVSMINDLTDLEEDHAAGKPNRMAGRSGAFRVGSILLPMAAGLAFAWLWRRDALLLGSYLAAWLCFGLYSVPPFRLKARGIAGVIADAAGSNLFPAIVAVLLVFRGADVPLDQGWLAAAGIWAFAFGLRGIIWHQLRDAENDRAAGVRTFAQRHRRQTVIGLGKYLAFPTEVAALGLLLWRLEAAAPLLMLAAYALLVAARLSVFRMQVAIVESGPRHMILLQEYYDLLLPLALLLASATRHPVDLLVVAVHLLLFPRRALQILGDVWKLRHAWRG